MIKTTTKLLKRKKLTHNIDELIYSIPQDFTFNPGQFVNIDVTKPYRRPYSIVDVSNGEALFLIEYIEGGIASEYFKNAPIGSETIITGPLGRFSYKPTNFRKVFASTGTGIAPLIPIIKDLKEKMPDVQIDLYCGARVLGDEIAYLYLKDLIDKKEINFYRCITREDASDDPYFRQGRVTELIPRDGYDWKNTEFYLCGSRDMIKDMRAILTPLGADKIYYELYY